MDNIINKTREITENIVDKSQKQINNITDIAEGQIKNVLPNEKKYSESPLLSGIVGILEVVGP